MRATTSIRFLLCFVPFFALADSASGQASSTAHIPKPPAGAKQPMAGMGMMAGEVTDSSALVQLRLTKDDRPVNRDVKGTWGSVEFTLRSSDNSTPPIVKMAHAMPPRDFIARVQFVGLKADTKYVCTTRIGLDEPSLCEGPRLEFKTNPGSMLAKPVRFAVVTGMNYAKFHGDNRIDREQHRIENNSDLPQPYVGSDKQLGYPALETILKLKPDFFVGTGDNVYYDTPDNPRAQTISKMRQKWHEQFVQPRFISLFAAVPGLWMVDDHDFRVDDCDNAGEYLPLPETSRRILLEQLPYASTEEPAAKTYRTHRVSRDLQIWLTENRFYRSPNLMEDGPNKSIWGDEQKRWLKESLLASEATYKILISPTPMIGPDDLRKTDNHCDVGGFQHERDEFFEFLKTNGLEQGNFFIVCGDRHWQYHAVDATGMEEFSCGALIDQNSRLGRKPGDPAGTDPQALIKHLHQQTEPSGGFLMIHCQPTEGRGNEANGKASLAFEFHDEHGKLLYRCQK